MTQTDDWGELKRLAEDAKRLGANGTMLPVDAVLELIAENAALKAQVAEERDWQNEIRKVCKEAMGGNTTFIDDDVARAITALTAQRDEMAEALEWYADRENYVDGPSVSETVYAPYYPILDDKGKRARKVIGASDEN